MWAAVLCLGSSCAGTAGLDSPKSGAPDAVTSDAADAGDAAELTDVEVGADSKRAPTADVPRTINTAQSTSDTADTSAAKATPGTVLWSAAFGKKTLILTEGLNGEIAVGRRSSKTIKLVGPTDGKLTNTVELPGKLRQLIATPSGKWLATTSTWLTRWSADGKLLAKTKMSSMGLVAMNAQGAYFGSMRRSSSKE